MFRQVLVPVEFSASGHLAARHACEVVRAIGGTVTLLHVLEISEPERRDLRKPTPENARFEEARMVEGQFREAQALLRRLSLYARRSPVCLIVPATNGVAPVILDVAARIGAELIILGLHRQDGSGEGRLGRVVQQVLLGASVPVQVTPDGQFTDGELPDEGWRGVLSGRPDDLR